MNLSLLYRLVIAYWLRYEENILNLLFTFIH